MCVEGKKYLGLAWLGLQISAKTLGENYQKPRKKASFLPYFAPVPRILGPTGFTSFSFFFAMFEVLFLSNPNLIYFWALWLAGSQQNKMLPRNLSPGRGFVGLVTCKSLGRKHPKRHHLPRHSLPSHLISHNKPLFATAESLQQHWTHKDSAVKIGGKCADGPCT